MEEIFNKKQRPSIEDAKPNPVSGFVADSQGNIFIDDHSLEKYSSSFATTRKFLVCLDDSTNSHLALLHALYLMNPDRNDEIELLHIIPPHSSASKALVPLGQAESNIIKIFEKHMKKVF